MNSAEWSGYRRNEFYHKKFREEIFFYKPFVLFAPAVVLTSKGGKIMPVRPIGEQIPFQRVFQEHLGAPAAFCHDAYLILGTCQKRPQTSANPRFFLGSSGLPLHSFFFLREDLAATAIDAGQGRSVAREFGIDPFSRGYGVEPIGTGVGMGNVLRYDAYLSVYEQTGLDHLKLTEQATSDPISHTPSEWEKLKWADRRRAALLTPYGYIIGVVQTDTERGRLLMTDGTASSPSFTIFRNGITFKETTSRTLPKEVLAEMGAFPSAGYDLHQFSEWKEHVVEVGRLFLFGTFIP